MAYIIEHLYHKRNRQVEKNKKFKVSNLDTKEELGIIKMIR